MSGEPATILIIEDDPNVRESVAAYLEDSGYRILEAGNGREGMELVESHRPDLVLTDLKMPVMGGLAVLAAMAADFGEIPVIIVSGQGELTDAIQSLKLGAWDYLAKPILDMAALEHAVQRSLERAELLRQNREYQARLEETVARLRQILGTLREDEEAGRRIQFQLLPEERLQLGPVMFQRLLLPSASLSGDFVDYFRIDSRYLGFYLADVAGHGVSSALVTVILQNSMSHYLMARWQERSDLILDPGGVLEELNRILLGSNLDKHLTMFYGILDLESSVLRFANAGQFPLPILYDGERARCLGSDSMPVGLFRDAGYRVEELPLPEHFLLFLCSDGVLELMPQTNIEQKEAALMTLVDGLEKEIGEFVEALGIDGAPGEYPDDVTLLLLRR
jgi:sigma-B regulation protein RsbU (phosphoserine phosphatase)